jgi:gliding motility-associated-like protein
MAQPADTIVCNGAKVNVISFASSIANTTFNWINNQPTIGLAASGSGNIASFKAVNTSSAPVTATIRVTPVLNGCSGDVRVFTITINPSPATPVVSNLVYCQYDNALPLSVPVDNGNILRWYDAGTEGNLSLTTPTPSTSTEGTKVFYVSQFNQTTLCESPRASITVRVNAKPVIQNITSEVCNKQSFDIKPSTSVTGITYSWVSPSMTNGLSGEAAASGQSSIKGLLENTTSANQVATYTVTPSIGNCIGTDFKITVTVKPSADIKKKEITICSGTNFKVQPVDGQNNDRVPSGTAYSWYAPILTSAGIIAGGSSSPSAQNQISQTLFNNSSDPATATYTVAPKTGVTNGCSGDSFVIVVNVTPRAKIQKQTVTICSRTSFDVKPVNKAEGNIVPTDTKYIWSNPVVTPAGSITGGSAQTIPQSSISQKLENKTTATAMIVYKVTPVTGNAPSCEGDVFEIVVYVNPQVGINDQHTEICSGEVFGVVPSGTPVYTTYTWGNPQSTPAGAVTGGFAQSIPQKAISQELNNTTHQTAVLTYTVSPKTGNCTDATFLVHVKVYPKPFVKDTILPVCTGNNISYKPENNIAGAIVPANTKYAWSNPVISPAGAVSGFSSQAVPQAEFKQTLINNTSATATITYTLIAHSGAEGNCVSKSFKVTLTVQPNAKAIMNFNKNVNCAPFALNTTSLLNASPATASNQYQWFINGQLAGTQRDFPGYTMNNANDSVLIQLVAVSDYGCKNDTVNSKFYTSPIPDAIFATNADTICGTSMIAIKNSSVQSNVLAYRWDFGNGQSSSVYQPDSIRYRASLNYGDTTYTIKLSVISACDTATYSKQVVIRSAPKASFVPNRVVGCSPVQVLFANTSQGLNNNYTWNFGDGTPTAVQQNEDTITHWYYSGIVTTFDAMLTVTNHCGTDFVKVPMSIRPNSINLEVLSDANFTKGCAPLTVKFINRSSGSNSYKWDFGDGNVIIRPNGNDTIAHTYAGLGKFDVQVFANNGCSDTSTYVTEVQSYATPVAGFSSDKQMVCRGESIQLTNESLEASTYFWNFGNGIQSNDANPAYAYTTGGTFNIRLIAVMQHAPGVVCADTTTQSVIVKDSASTAMMLSGENASCTPFVVNFNHEITDISSAMWDFGDGTTSGEITPSHTYNKNGTYRASLSVTTKAGCTYTSARVISVTAPEGTASMQSGFQCMNVPVQMNASAFNTDSIEWNFGDGHKFTTGNIGMASHTYRNPGVYVPKVMFRNMDGCMHEVAMSDTIRIEDLRTGFKTIVDKSCGYTEVQFVDTSRSLYGVQQVEWQLGDGAVAAGDVVKHRYTLSGNYKISMETKGNAGCNASATDFIKVDVSQKPQAIIVSDKNICTDLLTSFKSNAQSTDAINFYKWQISNGFQSNKSEMNYRFAEAGIYHVMLIAGTEQQCFDTAHVDFEVLQTPTIQVNDDLTICRDKSVALQVNGAVNYSWYPVEGLTCAGCPDPVARPFETTQYVVKGVAANGCHQFDTVTVFVKQPFKISVNKSDSICMGSKMQLVASGAESYSWLPTNGLSNPLSGTPVATPRISTTYRVVGTDNLCFTDTAYVRIGVGNIPSIELGEDQTLNTGAPYKIKPVITNGPIKSWSWTPANDLSCSDCPEPVAAPGNNTTYVATAVTEYGCVAKDTIRFKVFCENSQVFIPNGFTPDGDGINDIVMVRARGISKVRYFRIFNRWGEMVFERYNFQPNDPANGWDGKIKGQESGPAVYVYLAEVECSNGTPFTYKGNITLIK